MPSSSLAFEALGTPHGKYGRPSPPRFLTYLQQLQDWQPDLQQAASALQQPQHSPAIRETPLTSSVANNPSVIITFFISILLFLKFVLDRKLVCDREDFRSEERRRAGRNRRNRSRAARAWAKRTKRLRESPQAGPPVPHPRPAWEIPLSLATFPIEHTDSCSVSCPCRANSARGNVRNRIVPQALGRPRPDRC